MTTPAASRSADLAADVVGVLDALGRRSAHLAGISMGGALAQRVALAHPDRVDSLVLMSTSPAVQGAPGRSELPPMSEDLRAYFAAEVPRPDWAERTAVIDYLVGYERHLEAAEYFDEAHVRARGADRRPHQRCGGQHDEPRASQQRINLVAVWRESPVFTDAERAALELAEQGTRIADAADGVTDEAWQNAAKYYDEDQLMALVGVIGLINLYNRFNVITQQPAGDYQPGQFG